MKRLPAQSSGAMKINRIPASHGTVVEMPGPVVTVLDLKPGQYAGAVYDYHKLCPNCIGAMDGKHVRIKPPPNSGSYYYNFKKQF